MTGFWVFIGVFISICVVLIFKNIAASRWWKSVSRVYKDLDNYTHDGNLWLAKWEEAEKYYYARPWYV